MPHCSPITLGMLFALASAITAWTTIRSLLVDPLSPLDIVPSMILVERPAVLSALLSTGKNFA